MRPIRKRAEANDWIAIKNALRPMKLNLEIDTRVHCLIKPKGVIYENCEWK